jgi:alkaline phosphatase isozyme conversion protein
MLELAERLKNVSTHYGIRFIATSGEEEGNLGAQNILSANERCGEEKYAAGD